jgi:hypothetical protein
MTISIFTGSLPVTWTDALEHMKSHGTPFAALKSEQTSNEWDKTSSQKTKNCSYYQLTDHTSHTGI